MIFTYFFQHLATHLGGFIIPVDLTMNSFPFPISYPISDQVTFLADGFFPDLTLGYELGCIRPDRRFCVF